MGFVRIALYDKIKENPQYRDKKEVLCSIIGSCSARKSGVLGGIKMKTFRCPWCGEVCITGLSKAFCFVMPGQIRKGNRCPVCNKRYVPKSRFLIAAFYLAVMGWILYLGISRRQKAILNWGFLTLLIVVVFMLDPLWKYWITPAVRAADIGNERLSIPTQAAIVLDQPVSLIREEIFAIRFIDPPREAAIHKDEYGKPIPVYLEKKDGWKMGFLKPELYHLDDIPAGASFEVMDDRHVLTTGHIHAWLGENGDCR